MDGEHDPAGEAGEQTACESLAGAAAGERDPAVRRDVIEEGVVRFGLDFVYALYDRDDDAASEMVEGEDDEDGGLGGEATAVLLRWLAGARLSERSDEAELRVATARDALEELGDEVSELEELAAVAMLELPEDHPDRDVEAAGALLHRRMEHHRDAGSTGDELRTLARIVRYGLGSVARLDELCDAGLEVAAGCDDEDAVAALRAAVHSFYVHQALEVRDAVGVLRAAPLDERAYRRWMAKADATGELLAVGRDGEADWGAALERATAHDRNGRFAEAADLYGRVWREAPVDPSDVAHFARREAELRLMLGEPERAIQAAAPLVEPLTERYVTAVRPEDIADVGADLGSAAATLAFAHAQLGRFGEAVRAIDRAKSVRLRHAAALRRRPEGRRVLALERALERAERGLDVDGELLALDDDRDAAGARTLKARLLEAYRRARPLLDRAALDSPDVAQIGVALDHDEAAVLLGIDTWGTLVAVVRGGETGPEPTAGALLDAMTLRAWIELLAPGDDVGWLVALGFWGEEIDRPAILDRVLADVEAAFGRQLRALIPAGVRRIVLVAHGLTHVVPFWALESLADLDVLVAPSAATIVASAGERPALAGRALVISNPTLDLRVSPAEVAAIREPVAALGLDTVVLEGSRATQSRVTQKLADAAAVHVIAHGRSMLWEAKRSALLLAADDEDPPLRELLEDDAPWEGELVEWEWDHEADEGHVDLDGVGRLHERLHPGGLTERWIERGRSDPWLLLGENGPLAHGQLWQAGEIVLGDGLESCALVYLAACDSGQRGAGMIDEDGGLPAAFALAGAASVVATMWPVSEPLACLYAHLFYGELARRAGDGTVPLSTVARTAGRRLRKLTADEARGLCRAIGSRCGDPWAAFALEAFAHSLAERGEHPFARPFDWAAFYVTGAGRLTVPTRTGAHHDVA